MNRKIKYSEKPLGLKGVTPSLISVYLQQFSLFVHQVQKISQVSERFVPVSTSKAPIPLLVMEQVQPLPSLGVKCDGLPSIGKAEPAFVVASANEPPRITLDLLGRFGRDNSPPIPIICASSGRGLMTKQEQDLRK